MSTSMTAIIIICVVAIAALAAWLISVMIAARDPRRGVGRGGQLRGDVQGGRHVGGGRSVSPLPDEPATPHDRATPGGIPDPDSTGPKAG